jgi:hypothetical protein
MVAVLREEEEFKVIAEFGITIADLKSEIGNPKSEIENKK